MKKFLLMIILLSTIFTTACDKYITAQNNNEQFYGYFNRRDMIHADVILYKKNSSVICDGVIFLNAPSRSFTLKNDQTDAKILLGCSDKRIIDANLKMRKGSFDKPYGLGIDQFDNKYTFSTIKSIEYKKNVSRNKKELNKTNFLKY